MGKRALKMRIKVVRDDAQSGPITPTRYAVQQRFRTHQIMSWLTLDTFASLEECVQEYPYLGVQISARKLGLKTQ